MATLDEKVLKFHKLAVNLNSIDEEPYFGKLKQLLNKELSDYFHKNAEDGKLKWKDDNQIKGLAEQLWDKAADHLAEHYLKLSPEKIKEMKKDKDPDTGKSLFEHTIKTLVLGLDKDDIYQSLKGLEYLEVENLPRYIENIYGTHSQMRKSKAIQEKIKNPEDAVGVLTYLKTAKEHNPHAFKGVRLPKLYKKPEDAAQAYLKLISLIPKGYHPNKKETFLPKMGAADGYNYNKAA